MCKPVHNQSLSLSSISIVHNGGIAVVNNLRIPIQYSSIHTQLLIQHVIQQQQQRQRQLLQQQQQLQQHPQQQRPPMPTPTPTPTPTIPPAMSTAVGNGTTVQPQQQRITTRSVRKSRRIAGMTNRNETNANDTTTTNNNTNNNHNRSVLHHQRFFLYIKIMLRILYEHKEYNILYKSKTTIDHCIQQNKAGNDNYSFFHDSVIVRLRTFVPELYWNLARDYLGYTCD